MMPSSLAFRWCVALLLAAFYYCWGALEFSRSDSFWERGSRVAGLPGRSKPELLRNWGAPDAIFFEREDIFPEFSFLLHGRWVSPSALPEVPFEVYGYREGSLGAVVVYLDRDGKVTRLFRGGT